MFDIYQAHVKEIGSKEFIDEPTHYELNCSASQAYQHLKLCKRYTEASIKEIADPIKDEKGLLELWFWRSSPTSTKVVACCYKERGC